MGMGTVSPSDIPSYVSASNPEGLRRAMLFNNIKKGAFINYFDIQFVNGKWFAWYFYNANNAEAATLIKSKG